LTTKITEETNIKEMTNYQNPINNLSLVIDDFFDV